jgi:hypothetical protein
MSGTVNALAYWAASPTGPSVYAGGLFTAAGSSTTTSSYNSYSTTGSTPGTAYVARWDISTSTWNAMDGGTSGYVNVIRVFNGQVYVGGRFATAGSGGLVANGIAKWSGTAWSAVGSSIAGYGVTNAAMSWSTRACSSPTTYGCASNLRNCDSTCATTGVPWTNRCPCGWEPGPNPLGLGIVNDIAVDSSGIVYVVGQFTRAGGSSRSYPAAGSSVTTADQMIPWSGVLVSHAAYWSPSSSTWNDMNKGFNYNMAAVQFFSG